MNFKTPEARLCDNETCPYGIIYYIMIVTILSFDETILQDYFMLQITWQYKKKQLLVQWWRA